MSGHSIEDVRKSVRVYIAILVALLVLTGATVGAAQMHLPHGTAIALGLAIAVVKGSLVALYFMHLITEERTIYWVLTLTVAFFLLLLFLPILTTATNAHVVS